jgi:esterase
MKLAFREYGAGTPLVILHGLFGQSDNWNTLARRYATEGLRVFAVDLRNHGLSPQSDDFNYKLLADDLHEFLETHHLESPVVMGHSLGGKAVLFHEHRYPGKASRIVIADMSPRAYQSRHDHVLEALNAVDFSRVRSRGEVEKKLAALISDPGTRQFLLKNVYWVDEKSTRLGWRFNLESITRHYQEINVAVPPFTSDTPAMVIRGEKSDYVTEDDVADFRARFTKLTVATIEGAGHWVHAEKPDAYFGETLAFIKS